MRSTKLSRFCDGLLEAGWLASLILAPLFFNTYSSRVFEPDKIALVRTIALVMAAAWSVKLMEGGGPSTGSGRGGGGPSTRFASGHGLPSVRGVPLILPVAILLSAYLISTLFSITPRVSFWGSYPRLQGTYTSLAYLVIFAAVAAHMRRKEQVERLITVIILTSLPVSLYGVMQKLQIDPLPWGEDTTERVTSTLGNAIFIGAYLIMAVPLTGMRVLESFRAILDEPENRQIPLTRANYVIPSGLSASLKVNSTARNLEPSLEMLRASGAQHDSKSNLGRNVVLAAVYVFIGAMQLLALWFSGSRGPWLGLLVGIFFWALLLSLTFKKRWLTLAILGGAGLMAAFLITLNIPNGPLEPLRNTKTLGRLGRVFEVQDGTSKVRVLIWQGAVKMVLPHDPILYPDGKPDALNFLRPIIGYGPESMYVAYNRFYSPEIAHYEKRTASPDRSHNETFDALVTTGVIGLLAYLALFAAVIYYGLKWMGIVAPEDKWLYVGAYAGGGAIGAMALVIWKGPEYFGVGLPVGILLGLMIFIATVALTRAPAIGDEWRAVVLATLLAAIVAHFAEIHFGIAIVSTRLHFWTYAGVLMAVGWAMPWQEAEPASLTEAARPGAPARKAPKGRKTEKAPVENRFGQLLPPLIAGLVLITMGYDTLANATRTTSIVEMLASSMTKLYGTSGATSFGILLLFITVWLAAAALLSESARAFGITLAVSAGVWLIFALIHFAALGALAGHQAQDLNELLRIVRSLSNLYTGFNLWVLAMMTLIALALVPVRGADFLVRPPDGPESPSHQWLAAFSSGRGSRLAAGVVFAAVLATGYFTNVLIIRANMVYKVAEPLDRRAEWDVVIPLYDQAIKLAPLEDQYYLFIGRAYLEASARAQSQTDQESLLNTAANELKIAYKVNPLNPDHSANLARLYSRWARIASNPAKAGEYLAESNHYYEEALTLSPNTPSLWNEWGRMSYTLGGDEPGALSKLETALKLDDEFNETYVALGDYWSRVGQGESDAAIARDDHEKALGYYQQAIAAEAHKPEAPKSLTARLGLAGAQKALGNWNEAISAYDEVIALAGTDYNLWAVYNALAESYLEIGDKAAALDAAQKALAAAVNAEDKATVQALIDKINK